MAQLSSHDTLSLHHPSHVDPPSTGGFATEYYPQKRGVRDCNSYNREIYKGAVLLRKPGAFSAGIIAPLAGALW